MTNTEISNDNPEKELIIDKSISDNKTKQIMLVMHPMASNS